MRIEVSVESPVALTPRVQQVCAMFDAPPAEKLSRSWSIDAAIEDQPWSVGLIVGPSGSGKSTVARQMFDVRDPDPWPASAVVDAFPDRALDQVIAAFSAVGFNTIPAWTRPHATLSTGEGFRADVARALLSDDEIVVIDEFTSTVDRQVARACSHAVQKHVRRAGRRFVAVTCHYDVIDWLQPDWTIEPATETFAWRSVQPRPRIEAEIVRRPYEVWRLFAPYHYLTASLNKSARCFCLEINGRPVSFAAMHHTPVSRGARRGSIVMRCSRLVTLPDWQGLGLGSHLIDTLSAMYGAEGLTTRAFPAHPVRVRQKDRSPVWACVRRPGLVSDKLRSGKFGGRPCAVFEYVGPSWPDAEQAQRVLAGDPSEFSRTTRARRRAS